MARVIFQYNGEEIIIQCQTYDQIGEICNQFTNKVSIDISKLIFLYGGEQVNKDISFEKQANSIDKEKEEIVILVYELDKFKENEIEKSSKNDEFEKEIEPIKEKLNLILSRYLDDRKYVEDRIDNWKNAIMKECEKLFENYNNYKFFVNLMIYDYSISQSNYYGRYSSFGADERFYVIFQTDSIKASIVVTVFSKDKKRNEKDLRKAFDLIEKEFLNLAEYREYEIFKDKYYEIFKDKLLNVFLIECKTDLFYYYRLSNKYYKFTISFQIFNKDKDDYFLSKIIDAGEIKLYIVLATPQ